MAARTSPADSDLLRDPADLSPAERTHDLVAAVARDDLLAVVLVLQNCYPHEVVADDATGRTALETALTRPTKRQDVRRLVTQCLLVCAPPQVARQGPPPPANPESSLDSSTDSVARQVWHDWNSGRDHVAPDATRLCFEMTMGQVEDWILAHGLGDVDSVEPPLPPPPPPPLPPREEEGEIAPASPPPVEPPPPASPVRVKSEPSPPAMTASISAEPAPPPPRHALSPTTTTTTTTTTAPSLGPSRLEIQHLPLSINIVSLRDLVGPSTTRHISLDVSLAHNEVTALVEVASHEDARAAVDRLDGCVYSDAGGTEEPRVLQASLLHAHSSTPAQSLPPPSPLPPPSAPTALTTTGRVSSSSLRDSNLPTSCPTSPRDDKVRSLAAASVGPGTLQPCPPPSPPPPPPPPSRDSRMSHRDDDQLGHHDHDRRRSLSPPPPRREVLREQQSSQRPGRSSSPAAATAASSPRRPRPRPAPPAPVQWLYVTAVSPRLCERALADILARVDVEAYDIRVEPQPAYRARRIGSGGRRDERIATIGVHSSRDAELAKAALEQVKTVDNLHMYIVPYRDPRSGRTEPPLPATEEEKRYPYVSHRYNLAHPPHPHNRDLVITGLDPAQSHPREVEDLVESVCGYRSVAKVRVVAAGPAGSGSGSGSGMKARVEMERPDDALRAIEELDGSVEHGCAITVNWDPSSPTMARPLRRSRSPPPTTLHNGLPNRQFRRYGDP
ncbi:hypothetical protein JCM3774_006209 [Rhodotorula dairenensis]